MSSCFCYSPFPFVSLHLFKETAELDLVLQNASLAGGVAMGSAANLFMTPGGELSMPDGCPGP